MKRIMISCMMIIGLALIPNIVYARDGEMDISSSTSDAVNIKNSLSSGAEKVSGEKVDNAENKVVNTITLITNILLFTIGAVSVIVIIYSGYKYVISGGDSGKVGEAKNAIKYAVIGIIVALLASLIVNFVIKHSKTPSRSSSNSDYQLVKKMVVL